MKDLISMYTLADGANCLLIFKRLVAVLAGDGGYLGASLSNEVFSFSARLLFGRGIWRLITLAID